MAKRLLDLALVVPGLLVLSPMFLFIALWIKMDSRGPVFFQQVRVGLNGDNFRILKFRTMVVDAENKGLKVTVGRDPRITRSGHYLRKYKLDELPQLINVLMGDMSLVGPRPEVPEFVAYYSEDEKQRVLSVRPGITDNASVVYRNENDVLAKAEDPRRAYIDDVLPEKMRYYLEYVDNHSLIGDIKIILRTFKAIAS